MANSNTFHHEYIRCPHCGCTQTAPVLHTVPFATYRHQCIKCGYLIIQSQWEPVPTPQELAEENISINKKMGNYIFN